MNSKPSDLLLAICKAYTNNSHPMGVEISYGNLKRMLMKNAKSCFIFHSSSLLTFQPTIATIDDFNALGLVDGHWDVISGWVLDIDSDLSFGKYFIDTNDILKYMNENLHIRYISI